MFIKFAHFCIALSQLDLVYLMCRIFIYMHTVTQPQSHRPSMFVFCNLGIFWGKLPGSQILWVSCAKYSAHFTLSIWFCQRGTYQSVTFDTSEFQQLYRWNICLQYLQYLASLGIGSVLYVSSCQLRVARRAVGGACRQSPPLTSQ